DIITTTQLSGTQSLYLKGDGFARCPLLGVPLDDGTSIKWRQQVTDGSWSTVSLNNSKSGGTTFVQFELDTEGKILILTREGKVPVGNYGRRDVYEVTIVLDFRHTQYDVTLDNLTNAAGPARLGKFRFAAPTMLADAAAGEILLRMRSGGLFDCIRF